MMKPLRQRHFFAWCVIAVLLPVGIAAGVIARPAPVDHASTPLNNTLKQTDTIGKNKN